MTSNAIPRYCGRFRRGDVGAESKDVRSGWMTFVERRRGACVEKETVVWADSNTRRDDRKSLRNEVHNANAVVWKPV